MAAWILSMSNYMTAIQSALSGLGVVLGAPPTPPADFGIVAGGNPKVLA